MPATTEPSWREKALCARTDTELFFPGKGEKPHRARGMCARCPVPLECLQDALDRGERYGVRGGLTERDLRKLASKPVPPARCPGHGLDLTRGPVLYRCPAGHDVSVYELLDARESAREEAAA